MTSVSAHLRPSGGSPTSTAPATSPWGRWSAAWTRQAATLTGRLDAIVTVTPADGGPPGFSYPATAQIQVDADLIADPAIADPRRPGHRSKVPVAYGVLLHECAHVIHSQWDPPPTVAPVVREAALLLEESRIERRYRDTRPRDRRWLRRAVTSIIDPADTPTDTLWSAAYAAGLLLARVDARILYPADVREARRAITTVLGRKLIRGLRAVWREAHTVGDTDTTRMIELGERWCRLLGIDPTVTPGLPADDAATSAIAAAISGALDTILHNPADTPEPASDSSRPDGPSIHVDTETPITWAERDARDAERHAANRLTALLRRARHREPARTREPSAAPPGRLRTGAAVTLAAQHAAGAIPTAQPWQRTVRRPIPDPELTVGILIDASGSMEDFAKPMSSAAWIVAHAATRAGATSATLAYGDRITVLIPPAAARPQSATCAPTPARNGSSKPAPKPTDSYTCPHPAPHACSWWSPTATMSTPTNAKPPSLACTGPDAPSSGSHPTTNIGHPRSTTTPRLSLSTTPAPASTSSGTQPSRP
ncbi:VWA domain-containing protein [Micromonospora sp. NBC_00821]|uniref:VWA domain-containing protein n=1 Tax=Micromonospora sp. NBC_00821 TaxID=2975977 RepID=UPI002ED13871|nr:VWA domain-containing protein [Micromonospora sp. NBC_00821]